MGCWYVGLRKVLVCSRIYEYYILFQFQLFVRDQEIDHVGYVRQAFDSAAFNYFLDILHSDLLKESEVCCLYLVFLFLSNQ